MTFKGYLRSEALTVYFLQHFEWIGYFSNSCKFERKVESVSHRYGVKKFLRLFIRAYLFHFYTHTCHHLCKINLH